MHICLRGVFKDPRDCGGYDCALDIYTQCVKRLQQKQEERYAKLEGREYRMPSEPLICDDCSKFDKHSCPKRNEVFRSAIWANYCEKFYRKRVKVKA